MTAAPLAPALLGWLGILRLGLVQTALGSIVVLTTSTLNRVMIVELGLAAVLPGALVGLHYGVQITRPLWGHGSDRGGRRTPWIVGGIALLALAGTAAAASAWLMAVHFAIGLLLSVLSFAAIGIGVGAAGTSLLALLASSVAPQRRPAAATIVWLMMILGIALTAFAVGSLLDPFSMPRLIAVTAATGVAATALTIAAVLGVEAQRVSGAAAARPDASFRESFADAWSDPQARLFTIFVFVSMLAYSMQELILEPFAGLVFAMTVGETTRLSGIQNGGVFLGMVVAGAAGSLLARPFPAVLKHLTLAGCVASALALGLLALAAAAPAGWPLAANVFALGFANGIFAVAAIAMMMNLAGAAGPARTGLRMGLWGAAQALGFGLGGFAGTLVVDLVGTFGGATVTAYAAAFSLEGLVFLAAAVIAARIAVRRVPSSSSHVIPGAGLAGLQAAE